MTQIFIEPASVRQTSGVLRGSALKLLAGSRSTSSALRATGGLPPEFRGRAIALGARVTAKPGRMADLCVMMGLELGARADMAMREQHSLMRGTPGLLPRRLTGVTPATSRRTNFWNPAMRRQVDVRPGALAASYKRMVDPPRQPPRKPPATGCEVDTLSSTSKFGLAVESALKDRKAQKEFTKILNGRSPHLLTPDDKRQIMEQARKAGIKAFIGLSVDATAIGATCTTRIAGSTTVTAGARVKGGGKAGIDGGYDRGIVSGGAGIGASAGLEGKVSAGNDTARVNTTGSVEIGAKADAKVEAGMRDGKLKAALSLSLVAGVGGSIKISGEIDLKKLLESQPDPRSPRIVPVVAPDGSINLTKR